ncbi:MAG: aminotransferase class III-fold pyridoxal phosphate-dependent enzyme, partial [Pseudomonadota bacterium]|nr:aminotransferase class III-fold pyridoxal phosphate-dependent enzyme [Pseudomonadota bacterium]
MLKNKTDNQNLRQRLHNVIPGGAHTYSRGDDQFPENAPALLDRGKGAYVWDTEGRRYLDYGMALRSVTIGYADDRVNAAALDAMNRGVGLTRASMIELEAAERLCDLIPGAEMVKFAKNGSNVTTAAAKIARAYTGRRYICVPRQHPFFS